MSIQAKSDHPAPAKPVLKRLWGYLRPESTAFILAMVAMGVVAATKRIIPKVVRDLLDQGFDDEYAGKLWQVPAMLVGIAMVRGIAQFASTHLLSLVSNKVLLNLRMKMFERLLQAPVSCYQRNTAASIINAVIFEVNRALQVLTGVFIALVHDSMTMLALLIFLSYTNWRLTLVVAVILLIIRLLVSCINRHLCSLNRGSQNLTNQAAYVVEKTVGGYRVAKLHGDEVYESLHSNAMTDRLRGYAMRVAVAGGLNQPVTQFLAALALSVILAIAVMQAQANQTTVGGFTGFVIAMLLLISPLKHLTDVNQSLQRGLAAAEFIFGLIDMPVEPQESGKRIDHARGDVRFDNVALRYGEDGRAALDSVNLHVKPGGVVALVGPSGGGKTTLMNLLPRSFDPTSGTISLDGDVLTDLALHDLRRQITFVSQDVVLFNDTIATNMAYGARDASEIDMTRVRRAPETAYLTDVMDNLLEGIDTNVGDSGSKLSGGWRQCLTITRVIYKDAPILIPNEATSALDSESERQVQAALERLMEGRTTLVITHRLSTIENADRIIVPEHGKIAETDTHRELIECDGLYAGLHRIQFATQ